MTCWSAYVVVQLNPIALSVKFNEWCHMRTLLYFGMGVDNLNVYCEFYWRSRVPRVGACSTDMASPSAHLLEH